MKNFRLSDSKIKVFFTLGLGPVDVNQTLLFCPSHLWCKSLYILKIFSVWEKNTNINKIFLQTINVKKIHSFFLLRASTHPSFTFNLWFMSWSTRFVTSLKICVGFPIFDSVLFLLKFIFLFSKKYGLFDFKGASKKNCESVKKGKFVMKIFFQIMLNEVLKSCENDIYWCKS